ncbi:DUF2474 family protein [Vibrio gelatinilyticus]|jgi:hypothetical protein
MLCSNKNSNGWKKAAWFVLIWSLSVLTLSAVAYAIRFALGIG